MAVGIKPLPEPRLTQHQRVSWWRHQTENFSRYWPFVRRIHWSSVNSPHKGQWRGALKFSLICALNKRLNKQLRYRWCETPPRSLWRHCIYFANHLRAVSQEVLIDLIRDTCSDWIVKITTTYPWGQWVSNLKAICLLKNNKSYNTVFLFVVFDMIFAIIIGHYIKWSGFLSPEIADAHINQTNGWKNHYFTDMNSSYSSLIV